MEYVVKAETREGNIAVLKRGFASKEELRTTPFACQNGSGCGWRHSRPLTRVRPTKLGPRELEGYAADYEERPPPCSPEFREGDWVRDHSFPKPIRVGGLEDERQLDPGLANSRARISAQIRIRNIEKTRRLDLEKSWRNQDHDYAASAKLLDSIGAPSGARTPVFAVRGRVATSRETSEADRCDRFI
jgi:hypothetical protein